MTGSGPPLVPILPTRRRTCFCSLRGRVPRVSGQDAGVRAHHLPAVPSRCSPEEGPSLWCWTCLFLLEFCHFRGLVSSHWKISGRELLSSFPALRPPPAPWRSGYLQVRLPGTALRAMDSFFFFFFPGFEKFSIGFILRSFLFSFSGLLLILLGDVSISDSVIFLLQVSSWSLLYQHFLSR